MTNLIGHSKFATQQANYAPKVDVRTDGKLDKREEVQPSDESAVPIEGGEGSAADIYTIDAAKKMKYDQLFPVEAKKFGYDPLAAKSTSVEQALDDRVKKKADRYCK
ncbi:hypothetical protein FRX31_034192 [Thalictrum thalictroides]|uniref:Uncharacterized protein n=1 Tax=Thalictrum thalictroides TaxID=46969 RepID=A0A7J6UUS0_THATH|nr:hypothetical protein FRX31_034192 [Thalictrum thalictroides]